MYPILFKWGTFIVPSWHALFIVAAIASYVVLFTLAKKHHPKLLNIIHTIYLLAYIGGLLGARWLSVLIEEEIKGISQFFYPDSLTLFGGVIGGFVVTTIYVFIRKLPFAKLWDLVLPSFLVGVGIGRIGCFLNGDDYGIPVSADSNGQYPWWSVVFPNHPDPIPRVPVQLFEATTSFALGVVLFLLFRNIQTRKLGLVGSLGMIGYCCLRFFYEYFRDDFRGWFVKDLISTSQGFSILVILTTIALNIIFHRKKMQS